MATIEFRGVRINVVDNKHGEKFIKKFEERKSINARCRKMLVENLDDSGKWCGISNKDLENFEERSSKRFEKMLAKAEKKGIIELAGDVVEEVEVAPIERLDELEIMIDKFLKENRRKFPNKWVVPEIKKAKTKEELPSWNEFSKMVMREQDGIETEEEEAYDPDWKPNAYYQRDPKYRDMYHFLWGDLFNPEEWPRGMVNMHRSPYLKNTFLNTCNSFWLKLTHEEQTGLMNFMGWSYWESIVTEVHPYDFRSFAQHCALGHFIDWNNKMIFDPLK
jgi:hypothetical protein